MKYKSVIFLLSLFLFSCNKDFLDTISTDQLGKEDALSTDKNIYAALNGIYRQMVAQYAGNQACGGEPSMCIFRDCLGEDLVHPNTSNNLYLGSLRWQDHRNETSVANKFPFQFYYYLILQANLILEAVDQSVVTDTTVHLREIRGEALGMRAWGHFQLVQLYGKRYETGVVNNQPGVPYRLSSSLKPMVRTTVEECYQNIHKDLDSAIYLLKPYVPVSVTHLSLKVVYGLKARVYLTQQEYGKAASYSEMAIQKAEQEGFALMKEDECLNGFSRIIERTREALWAANTLDDQTVAFYSFYAYMSWNFNSTAIRLTPRCINSVLYGKLSTTDIRRHWWDPTGKMEVPSTSYRKAMWQNRKFKVDNITISAGDFAYMRLAELYLMKAEALARGGEDKKAQQVLYEYAETRDPSYILSEKTGKELCDEIMIHRRVELWGEGFRFSDLKRLNASLDRTHTNHIQTVCSVLEVPVGDVRWQWLIPEGEITASGGLVKQNE